MLEAAAMRRYVQDGRNPVTHDFIDEAVRNGDRCYALFDGDTLASYSWFATQPVRLVGADDRLVLRVSAAYAFMYNGFTLPARRGQRLYAVGMGEALEWHLSRGLKGLVGCIASCDFGSSRWFERAGCLEVGRSVSTILRHRRSEFSECR